VNRRERAENCTKEPEGPIENDAVVDVEPAAEDAPVEAAPEAEENDDAVATVEEPYALVITISRADLQNPAKLFAAIAGAISGQSGGVAPRELQLVLQPANGSRAAGAATKTIIVPIEPQSTQLPEKGFGSGSGRAVAATIAAVVQAALTYAKEPGVAKPQPASGAPVANSFAANPGDSSKAAATIADGEKTSGSKLAPAVAGEIASPENFLSSHNQRSTIAQARAGTDGALQEESMRSASRQNHNRLAAHHVDTRGTTASGATAGMDSGKGWTNGGGEQAFTNARFSHLAERVAGMMTSQSGPASPTPAPTAPVAPSTPAVPVFPVSEIALLGPLSNAVERMILRGQDQLSLTIRFEQGGSLALRLALQDGEIKTQIRTNVAGLENALRAAWTTFSQDWSNRGVKFAQPVFSTSPETTPDQHHSTAHQDARSENERREESMWFHGHNSFGAPPRHSRARSTMPAVSEQPSRTHQHGLHVWA